MNYSRLFNNFSPQKKCGASEIISGIGTGLSTIGGLFDVGDSMDARDRQLSLTKEENEKNRKFQAEEAEKNRQFAQSTMNQQMKYNSAPEQVNRLQSAGVNPTTAFSNSAGSAGSVTQPSPTSAPSGSAIPPTYNPLNIMQKMSLQGAYLKSLAETYKTSEEGSQVRELAEAEIAKRFSEANLNELRSQGQEISNMIVKHTGLREKEAQISQMIAQKDLFVAQKVREIAQKGLTEAQTNREIEQLVGDVYDNVYKEFQARFGKAKAEMAEIDLQFHRAEVIQNLKLMASQETENYASASRQRSEADVAEVRARLDNLEFDIKNGHKFDYAESLISEWQKNKDLSDTQAAQARQNLKAIQEGNRSAKEVDKFIRWLSNSLGISMSVSN